MATPQPIRSSQPHIHVAGANCPVCDQPIPNEKVEQVRAKVEARERELSDAVTARLKNEFAQEKVQIQTNANAVLEQHKKDSAATLEALKSEFATREAAAREEAARTAKAEAAQQIESLTQANAALQQSAQEKIAEAQREKATALQQYQTLQANHEEIVSQRVLETREAMEKSKTEAVNAIKSEHFEEKQKLTTKLEDLTRQLEKKTAEERGEGAEVNLFEALKAEFPRDQIRRVGKGSQGADIIHEIVHNHKVCGRIVYDCKDRNAWRNDYTTKLREDQIAAKAEHAILASRVFPAGEKQLCEQNGVLIANPARVIALVQVIRRHVVHIHTLKLSNEKRQQKTVALYEFITSERCNQLLERVDSHAEELLKLQAKEKKDHDALWKKQGTLLRGVQKAKGDLSAEIDRIIESTD